MAAVAGLLLILPSAACSSGGCTDAGAQPREVRDADVRQVDDDEANLLVDLSGALPDPLRVTGTSRGAGHVGACASGPISRYGHRVDTGPAIVAVRTGTAGRSASR